MKTKDKDIYKRRILEVSYRTLESTDITLENLRELVNNKKVTRVEVDDYYDSYSYNSASIDFYTERKENDEEYKVRINIYEKYKKAEVMRKATILVKKIAKEKKEKDKILAEESEERALYEKLKLKFDNDK